MERPPHTRLGAVGHNGDAPWIAQCGGPIYADGHLHSKAPSQEVKEAHPPQGSIELAPPLSHEVVNWLQLRVASGGRKIKSLTWAEALLLPIRE